MNKALVLFFAVDFSGNIFMQVQNEKNFINRKIDILNSIIITGILITKTKIVYITTNGDGL